MTNTNPAASQPSDNFPTLTALKGQPPAASQPTLYQFRMRPIRNNAIGWTAWKDCSEWSASAYEYPPKPCDWQYEVRRLYATPQPPAASQPSERHATLRYERGAPGKENDMPSVVSCNWLPDGDYAVYLAAPLLTAAAQGKT